MVSTAVARENGLEVGSRFVAYGTTLTVAAIFDSDNQAGNDTVITLLPVLERLTGDTGQVSSAVVTVASLSELAAATSAIEGTLGPEASVTSNLAEASQAIGDLDSVKSIALYTLAGAVVVIVFLAMVMIVRERKREIGILKAISASNGRIMGQFTTEALTFTLTGLAVGLLAGTVAASAVTSALVSHSGASSATGSANLPGAPSPFLSHLTDVNAQVGFGVILEAVAAAVVVAVLASAATTWMIGRIQPAEVLRSE